MDECTDSKNKEQVTLIMVLLINGNIDHTNLDCSCTAMGGFHVNST